MSSEQLMSLCKVKIHIYTDYIILLHHYNHSALSLHRFNALVSYVSLFLFLSRSTALALSCATRLIGNPPAY